MTTERQRRLIARAYVVARALVHTLTLLSFGHALGAFWEKPVPWERLTDDMQTAGFLAMAGWLMTLRDRIHRLETQGIKLNLRAELVELEPERLRHRSSPRKPEERSN